MSNNSNLRKAKKAKNDEFYTLRKDVDNELQHYIKHFKDKVIYCNCDTENSAFVQYFKDNANVLGIKELLYSSSDFRGEESIELLKKADIVITNPPFSLFREYVAQLIEYNKQFLIIGNLNAIGYKEIFPLIKNNKLWLGYAFNKTMEFRIPADYGRFTRVDEVGNKYGKVPGCTWYTNLEIDKRHIKLETNARYYV